MHVIAYACLLASLVLFLGGGLAVAWDRWRNENVFLPWVERGFLLGVILITLSCFILFRALVDKNFSFKYVADYTDIFLPVFYRMTAFWAGQAGSLLFWGWMTAFFGAAFVLSRGYQRLSIETRQMFWIFYLVVMGFFTLLVTCWSNPFLAVVPAPADGNGLNPLLQHPGMIFHPPLLFLGYAGFTIPGCLALAQALSGSVRQEPNWVELSRNYNLVAWLTLTAGIILGGWWSYMELGWGGYWAWDPVENASLIPWFTGTALLHTAVLQRQRNVLHRSNTFLMALTLIMCFFGTYLVRSGVVDSLHAFGSREVGKPLLLFILSGIVLSIGIVMTGFRNSEKSRELSGLFSREGFLVVSVWMLLLLGIIILFGTMWPVFSQLWSSNPVGLEAGFYNKVCMPIFAVLILILMVCPWMQWKNGFKKSALTYAILGLFVGLCIVLYIAGVTLPIALLGACAAIAGAVGIATLFASDPSYRKRRGAWAAYGVHFGLALVALGIAFSGPYELAREAVLKPGEVISLKGYQFTYKDMHEQNGRSMAYVETEIEVSKDGKVLGTLRPQRRIYRKFKQPFAEASVMDPGIGLGDELYATLLGTTADKTASLKISIHPLINWLWIGGVLMCLFPFVGLRRHFKNEV